ncbi:hypothetical protein DFH07DRAFT_763588 [Mycena maculata]|uniref:Uncharacterized protein n=1 Tax=Mycena maculata TaxID=230809 RepID=A0AAD7KG70_9AGAR|nr:hypothetical protein DFH07DRAFT_763588 [Mycena maculata]
MVAVFSDVDKDRASSSTIINNSTNDAQFRIQSKVSASRWEVNPRWAITAFVQGRKNPNYKLDLGFRISSESELNDGLRIQEVKTKRADRVMVEDVEEERGSRNLGASLGTRSGGLGFEGTHGLPGVGLGTSWVPNERRDDEDNEHPEGIGAGVLDPAGLRDQWDLCSKLMGMD